MSKASKNFVTGALILSIAGMIARFLGMFFWLPLVNKLGDVGTGYYNLAFPIYNLFLAISYVGLPSAISKLVSEKMAQDKYNEANRIFKVALCILVVVGLISSVIMFMGTDWIIVSRRWSPQVKYSLWGLALAPAFVSIMGAFRGYFQGMQNMFPTGISQVAESIGRVSVGILLMFTLYNMYTGSPEQLGLAAGGATFGSTAGAIVGAIVLAMMYFKYNNTKQLDYSSTENISAFEIGKKVFAIALPITLASAVTSVIGFIDSMLVVSRLRDAGVNVSDATGMLGQLSGKTMTLINVPLSLSMAVALSILPAVAEAVIKKDKDELYAKMNLAIRFGLILGLPAAVGLGILSYPIFDLFYPKYVDGSILLTIMSVTLVFMILSQIFTAILQGLGHYYIPIINLSISAVIKGILTYILVGTVFKFNGSVVHLYANGAAIASIFTYVIYMILNYMYIRKNSGFTISGGLIIRPLISSAVMGVAAKFIYSDAAKLLHNGKVATILAITIAIAVYAVMLVWTKGITEEDLNSFPKGNKIIKIFKKARLMA